MGQICLPHPMANCNCYFTWDSHETSNTKQIMSCACVMSTDSTEPWLKHPKQPIRGEVNNEWSFFWLLQNLWNIHLHKRLCWILSQFELSWNKNLGKIGQLKLLMKQRQCYSQNQWECRCHCRAQFAVQQLSPCLQKIPSPFKTKANICFGPLWYFQDDK